MVSNYPVTDPGQRQARLPDVHGPARGRLHGHQPRGKHHDGQLGEREAGGDQFGSVLPRWFIGGGCCLLLLVPVPDACLVAPGMCHAVHHEPAWVCQDGTGGEGAPHTYNTRKTWASLPMPFEDSPGGLVLHHWPRDAIVAATDPDLALACAPFLSQGNNVSMIMPQPFSGRHAGYMQRYIQVRARRSRCACATSGRGAACVCDGYCGHTASRAPQVALTMPDLGR
mgnify:CR=1 FL=1